MRLQGDKAVFGIEIPLADFGRLATAHFRDVEHTAEIESNGRRLVADGFPKVQVEDFVESVCGWGGYSGVSARVLRHNRIANIRSALTKAINVLDQPTPDLAAALLAVNGLKGLGGVSFASKHLRFLRPDLCPVFDGVLHTVLPYSFDSTGYAAFASDCSRLAAELTKRGVQNPWPGRNGRWFAADAEAAIFQWARSRPR